MTRASGDGDVEVELKEHDDGSPTFTAGGLWLLGDRALEDEAGHIEQREDGRTLVLTRVERHGAKQTLEMLRYDRDLGLLRVFPRVTRGGRLEGQFGQVGELQVESPDWDWEDHSADDNRFRLLAVRGLPKGFGSIYSFGLGVHRDYAGFVRVLEERTTCRIVRFVRSGTEGQEGETFRVLLDRFEQYRAAVDRVKSRARTAAGRVVDAETHNALSDLFKVEKVEPKYTKHPMIHDLTEVTATGRLTRPSDRVLLVDAVTHEVAAIAREEPERLGRLRNDIDLVSLETLIQRFEARLDGSHSADEKDWQAFFNANRFALQQIFSTPIVVVREQVQVGSADISGSGALIADFLCANTVTRTCVVVEIKTPSAKLVYRDPYRGQLGSPTAVHAPHRDLTGAVGQVQSHLHSAATDLALRLRRTPEENIDLVQDSRGAVIAGRLGALQGAQLDSFLRYRSGLSGVTVIGYDEVLEHLRALQSMLQEGSSSD